MKPFVIFSVLALCVNLAFARADRPEIKKAGSPTQVNLANPTLQDLLVDQFDVTVISAFYTAQNFEADFDIYDNEMADDFTVPAGFTWTLEDFILYGSYYNCAPCGPTTSFDVTIYSDAGGMPGSVVSGPHTIVATEILDTLDTYFFVLTFPAGVELDGGTYWVGFYANLDFLVGGQIGFADNDIMHGNLAKWRNPGGGFGTGCSSWGDMTTCLASPDFIPGPDVTYQLYGTSKISCESITTFQARCTRAGAVKARVFMTDDSHAGETITFTIEGFEYEAMIVTMPGRGKAQISVSGFGPGIYTVGMASPAGCFEDVMVLCPDVSGPEEQWEDDADEAVYGGEVPQETALHGNYPNPFNPSTTISYGLSQDTWVTLRVYNSLGQEVATIVNEFKHAGANAAVWNGKNDSGESVASGLYIYRLNAGNTVQTEKMLFMK